MQSRLTGEDSSDFLGQIALAACEPPDEPLFHLGPRDTERAEDPFANAESHAWKINQRVLSNTIEQALIFLPALTALAVRIDAAQLAVLPMAVTLWCAGRILFWI